MRGKSGLTCFFLFSLARSFKRFSHSHRVNVVAKMSRVALNVAKTFSFCINKSRVNEIVSSLPATKTKISDLTLIHPSNSHPLSSILPTFFFLAVLCFSRDGLNIFFLQLFACLWFFFFLPYSFGADVLMLTHCHNVYDMNFLLCFCMFFHLYMSNFWLEKSFPEIKDRHLLRVNRIFTQKKFTKSFICVFILQPRRYLAVKCLFTPAN